MWANEWKYKGFEYRPWEDLEEDNRKIFHDVYYKDEQVNMPGWFSNISPYRQAKEEEFKQAVDEIYFTNWIKNG